MLLEANPTAMEYQVKIGWRSLAYTEQGHDGAIVIYIDPPSRYGMPFAFYMPGENRWREVMPDWAAGRRAEIVARIKEECSHYHAEWVEG